MARSTLRSRRIGWVAFGIVAALVVGEIATRVVMTSTPEAIRWYDASAQLKVEQMDDVGDVDVVFAGTSMAWQAFVPAIHDEATSTSSYNAGLNGGTPEVMERWLLEEVVPRTHPETVVWGMSSYDLAPSYGDAQRDVYDDALESRSGLLADVDQRISRWSSLVRNRTVIRSVDAVAGALSDGRQADFDRAERTLGTGGERLDFTPNTSDELRDITGARLLSFAPDPDDVLTIGRTIRKLQAQGIDVVIVQLPVPQRFIDAHPNGEQDYAAVAPTFDAIASTMGARLLRFDDGFADNQFVDFTHLTPAATERFTAAFTEAFMSARDDRGTVSGIPGPSTGAIDRSDCPTETIIDEYGFEVEVPRCADGTTSTAADTSTDRATDLQDEAEVSFVDMLVANFVQRTCDGPLVELEAVPGSIDSATIEQALDQLEISMTSCGTDSGQLAWSNAIEQLEALAGIDRPVTDPTSVSETASRAITAVDVLRVDLLATSPLTASQAWFHSDEIEVSLNLLQRAAAGAPIDTVVIGSSIAQTQLDQRQLDDAFGGSFLNVAVAQGHPEVWDVLYQRLFSSGPRPTSVIWGITTHRLLWPGDRDCPVRERSFVGRTLTYRDAMFSDLRDALTDAELLFGPDVENSPVEFNPGRLAVADKFEFPGYRALNPGSFGGLPTSEARYPNPTVCADRFDTIAEIISEMRADGIEVTLVLLPLHSDTVAAAADEHAEVESLLRSMASDIDVPLLTIDQELTDNETDDGFHALAPGRERVTSQLLELLGR